jgi:hypothetical protein
MIVAPFPWHVKCRQLDKSGQADRNACLRETVCSKSEQKAITDERYRTLPLTER